MKRGQKNIPTQVVEARVRGLEGVPAKPPVPALGPGQDPHRLVGTVVDDRYRVIAGIAGGAMGYVYEAVQAPSSDGWPSRC